MHEGHRERMRIRLEREAGNLEDHELLEILLFFATPRVNTNPLAHELLNAFGGLEGILTADIKELEKIKGIGDSTLSLLTCMSEFGRRTQSNRDNYPKLTNAESFHKFVRERFDGLEDEVVELYAVDRGSRVYFIKRLRSAEQTRAKLNPADVSRFLAYVRPYGLAISHNHPSAPAEPSIEDDRFTLDMLLICTFNGVRMFDHVIAGKGGVFSYFAEGKLQTLKDRAARISGVTVP